MSTFSRTQRAFTGRATFYSQAMTLYDESVTSSAQLDTVMDSCGFDRYIFGGSYIAFAFSHHFPIGPIFTLYFHDYLGFKHPLYQETYQNMSNADLLVVPVITFSPKEHPIPASILAHFSESHPKCEGKGVDGYILKFRK